MSAATGPARAEDVELAARVASGAAALGLPLSAQQVDRFVVYVRLIERWNQIYNLTAVRDPRDMVSQHIVDCLAAVAALLRRRHAAACRNLLDVGSGAGLPGLVFALAAPTMEVTCVDSVGKKAAFITQAAGTLGLRNVEAVHGRVEAVVGRTFDVIASRAFAPLRDFVGMTSHLLAGDGIWMAMKGRAPTAELAALADVTFHVEPISVPGLTAERCLVWMRPNIEVCARL